MNKCRSLVFVTSALLLPKGTAHAEGADVDIDSLSQMDLSDLLNIDVTVASKVESSTADAPSSVTVFTQEEIRRMGVTTLQDLLNYVPGFQTMREVEQGLTDTIGARGRATQLSHSVLFLVDGQRLNDLYTGGAALLNRTIAIENIQQVEIIRGPGSALYGANAFLGVVDIKTLRGVNELWVNIGNIGTRVAAVAATIKTHDATIDGFARVSQQNGFDFEGVTDSLGQTGNQRNRASSIDAGANVEYKGATLRLRHMAREESGFLSFGALQDIDGNHESTRQSSAALSYTRKVCDCAEVTAGASYSEDEWKALSYFYPPGFEIAPGLVLEHEFRGGPWLRTRVLSANVDVQWRPSDAATLAAGVLAERSKFGKIADMYNYNPLTLEYQGRVREFTDIPFTSKTPRNEIGVYAQATYKFNDALTATAGVRLDYYNDFGSSVNPRAALVYKTPVNSRVKLMYGRAFRAPNYLELHDQYNPVDFGNPDLDPETVDTAEIAYVQDIGKVFRGTLTGFSNWLKNEIVFGVDGPMVDNNPFVVPTYANSDDTINNYGLEAELRAEVMRGLDIYATYSKLAGDETPAFPRNFGALAINFNKGPINANVSGIGRGQIATLGDQDPYVIANARIEYAITSHAAIFVNGRNLLDKSYKTPASVIPQGVPNDRLLVLAGVIATL